MKKELKNYIIKVYTPPSPKRKKEFISSLNYPKVRLYNFILSQVGYVRIRVWISSFLIFAATLLLGNYIKPGSVDLLWYVSALFPFLSTITITETIRSSVYGLAELEMTTRYDLHSVMYARMAILGIGNLMLLLIILPFLSEKVGLGMFKVGVYLLLPYLITSYLSYKMINRFRTKELSYTCAALATAISCSVLVLPKFWENVYYEEYFILWLAACLLITISLVKEIKKLIQRSEDLIWN